MGIAADALVAAFNPQLAAWSHSPFAAEVEQHLVRASRRASASTRRGPRAPSPRAAPRPTTRPSRRPSPAPSPRSAAGGCWRCGASRCSTSRRGPPLLPQGRPPRRAGHRGRAGGAGGLAPADDPGGPRGPHPGGPRGGALALPGGGHGRAPPSAGVVDPIADLAQVADEEGGLWLHVDAAWGGAAALVPELRPVLEGIGRASSVTFDAHKWLSVPMGAGMYLTRHAGHPGADLPGGGRLHAPRRRRPCRWRTPTPTRCSGRGGSSASRSSCRWPSPAGRATRSRSATRPPWATGCASGCGRRDGRWSTTRPCPWSASWTPAPRALGGVPGGVAADVVASGEAWISTVVLGEAGPALRACITNYRTGPEDVDALVAALGRARTAP